MVGAMFRHLHSLRQFRWALCTSLIFELACTWQPATLQCRCGTSDQRCTYQRHKLFKDARADGVILNLVCDACRRDHGWIHTLLEEAENERMHLLTFMQLSQPGPVMRAAVLVTQVRSG